MSWTIQRTLLKIKEYPFVKSTNDMLLVCFYCNKTKLEPLFSLYFRPFIFDQKTSGVGVAIAPIAVIVGRAFMRVKKMWDCCRIANCRQ